MTDREQLLALYRACFPEDDLQFWNWVFENLYAPENTLNARENGIIVASLQMIPCKMRLKKQLFAAHYIYAASTLPEKQGKGLMAGLLARAAEEGRKRGHDFSVLITQEDSLLDYYARFGYRPVCCIGMGEPRPVSGLGDVRIAAPADIAALTALYEAAAEGVLHGYRDESYWKLQLDLFGQGALVMETKGQITAYAFADERGVIEAVGTEAGALAAHIQSGKPWRTLPTENSIPMGSIKPLNEDAEQIVEQNPCFLNLMYN